MGTLLAGAVCGMSLLAAVEGTSAASAILVFGDHDAREQLAGILDDQGHDSVLANQLPADLAGYDAIWHVGSTAPLSRGEQTRLAAFVSSGRGLYLTGEGSSGASMNRSVQTLVNRLVGGSVQIGGLGDQTVGAHAFNTGAIGDVGLVPNELYKWAPEGCGGIAGIKTRNVLTIADGGTPTSAAFAGADLAAGQLVVMMDADWLAADPGRELTIQNLESFLEVGAPDDPRPPSGDPGDERDRDGNAPADDTDSGNRPGVDDPEVPQLGPVGAGCSTGGGRDHGPLGLGLLALTLLAARRRR